MRHRAGAVGAPAVAGDVRRDLFERGVAEGIELELYDRSVPGQGPSPTAVPTIPGLGDRHVDDALVAVAFGKALRDSEDAAVAADVLAQESHSRVGLQREVERLR